MYIHGLIYSVDIDIELDVNIDNTQLTYINNDINILSNRQRYVFDKLLHALDNTGAQRCFFIDGPGRSGKLFLLNCIINYMETINIKVTRVACTGKIFVYFMKFQLIFIKMFIIIILICTGMVATLLKNGKTVTTTFILTLDLDETTMCNTKPNTKECLLHADTKILIWDEITI